MNEDIVTSFELRRKKKYGVFTLAREAIYFWRLLLQEKVYENSLEMHAKYSVTPSKSVSSMISMNKTDNCCHSKKSIQYVHRIHAIDRRIYRQINMLQLTVDCTSENTFKNVKSNDLQHFISEPVLRKYELVVCITKIICIFAWLRNAINLLSTNKFIQLINHID